MKKRLLLAQYSGFITIGMVSSIIGPMLPHIGAAIPMDYGQAGMILSGKFYGMLLTVIIGGSLADRFGKKAFLLVGSAILFAGLLGCALAHNYISLLLCIILSGVGFGAYEIGINALSVDTTDTHKGSAMNVLHFFFGVGAILGPVVATWYMGKDYFLNVVKGSEGPVVATLPIQSQLVGWRGAFVFTMVLPLIVGLILLSVKIKQSDGDTREEASMGLLLKNKFLWLLGLVAFIYVGIEVSVYGWLSQFWQTTTGGFMVKASLMPSIFWIFLTAGRLLCGKIADRIGFLNYLVGVGSAIVVVSVSWWLVPFTIWTMLVVPLLGLLLAGIFPIIMVSATAVIPKKSGTIAAFIALFAALGGALIPSLVGRMADLFNIERLPIFILVPAVMMYIGAVAARKVGKHEDRTCCLVDKKFGKDEEFLC